MKEVEPDFHCEWEMSSRPWHLCPWWEPRGHPPVASGGSPMKERVLFYSNWKILQVIARDPRGGQCRELLGGRGVCQEGRGPCGAGHRPLHSAEGPGRDPATHFITVYFTICELLFNSQRPLTTSVILRVFSMTTMWPQTNFSSLKFCRKENKKKGLHFFSTLKAIQFKILLI